MLASGVRTVVLVEGASDKAAVEAVGRRLALDLRVEGVTVVAMGGATNIRHFLDHFGPPRLGLRVVGLCDEREARDFRRAAERSHDPGGFAFHVCRRDLEDELIRALGPRRVEAMIEELGDLASFRRFQKQPFQRERPLEAQLHRFLGTTSGRKERYASALVDALEPARLPAPLLAVLGVN